MNKKFILSLFLGILYIPMGSFVLSMIDVVCPFLFFPTFILIGIGACVNGWNLPKTLRREYKE